MDVKHLADKGDVYTSDKDRNILSGIDILKVVRTDGKTLHPAQKPEDVVALLASSKQNHFAVVDEKNRFIGLIDFDNIRHIAFNNFQIKYSSLADMMTLPQYIASVEDSVETIMEKFEYAKTDYLPILRDNKYYGFIYKCDVLESYRDKLREMVIE